MTGEESPVRRWRPVRAAGAVQRRPIQARWPTAVRGIGFAGPATWAQEEEPPMEPQTFRPAPPRADEQVVAALRRGDAAAFLSLVNCHRPAMLRVAALHVRGRAEAEEAVQEAWVGVLHGLDRFEGRSSLKSWIFSILVNCARSRAERERRSLPFSALEATGSDAEPAVPGERFLQDGERWAGHWASPPEPWPDAAAESGELVALVGRAMEQLPEAQRTVMALRDVDGWESAEVCQVLGLSEVNQRVLLHRARSKVRAFVEAHLGEGVAP